MTQDYVRDTEWSPNETEQTAFPSEAWRKAFAEIRGQSDNVADLMTALAKAQGEIGDIERDRTVKVKPRSGAGDYTFKYATLANIIKGIKKALSDNGLAYTQVITYSRDDQLYYLTTNLHHKNQFISSVTPLILNGEGNQQFGSALTYMKRYALAALVGIAADEDDDGNVADGNEVKAMQANVPKAPAPDVITTGPTIKATGYSSTQGPVEVKYNAWSPVKIDVPLLPDGSGSDWMWWGKRYIAEARSCESIDQLDALQKANEAPLKNMEHYAPKMYANLSVPLLKTRKELENKDAK